MAFQRQGGRSQPVILKNRIAALFLDYLVILAWMGVLTVGSLLVSLAPGPFPDTLGSLGPVGSQVLYFFLLTFVVGVYLYRTESGPHQATWGKRRLRLRVVDIDGAPVSKRRILLRTAVKLLPWELAHTFVWQMMWTFYQHGYDTTPPVWVLIGLNTATLAAIVYVIMVATTRRGPHDRAAGTRVVQGLSGKFYVP